MTFEEFFTKKRIDLAALKAGEPGLFAEFEKHFSQMGEKSFDHTKKYWFNKLRLQYRLAPEQKPEKMHQENRLAEQTIVETLTETIPPPTTGFKPRFKPGMAGKQATQTSDVKDLPFEESATSTPEVNEAAAIKDQNPPFQQEKAAMQDAADVTPRTTAAEESITEPSAPKPGFKPRFTMKVNKGEAPQTKDFEKVAEDNEEAPKSAPLESTASKPGFKPRFNMKTMAPKPEEKDEVKVEVESPAAEAKPVVEEKPATEEAPAAPKVGFKPRFNAKTTKPQTPPTD